MQMHDADKQQLEMMLQIPMKMKALPANVLTEYAKMQMAYHRLQPGSLPLPVLMGILMKCDAIQLPTPVSTKFGHLKEGDKLFFKVNQWETADCTFVSILDASTHTYLVRLWGEERPVAENQLMEHHPADVAAKVTPPEEDDDGEDGDEETPAQVSNIGVAVKERTDAAAAKKAKAEQEKAQADLQQQAQEALEKQWPKGKTVDCAIPGEAFFVGTVQMVGTKHPYLGRLRVIPKDRSLGSYRWVPAQFASEHSE